MGERKLENVERMFLKGLKQSMSQNHAKTTVTILETLDLKSVRGTFSLRGFFWNVLKPMQQKETRSESLAELLHFFFNVWRPFYVHRKTVCVGWCSVYKDITNDIQQLLNV